MSEAFVLSLSYANHLFVLTIAIRMTVHAHMWHVSRSSILFNLARLLYNLFQSGLQICKSELNYIGYESGDFLI